MFQQKCVHSNHHIGTRTESLYNKMTDIVSLIVRIIIIQRYQTRVFNTPIIPLPRATFPKLLQPRNTYQS